MRIDTEQPPVEGGLPAASMRVVIAVAVAVAVVILLPWTYDPGRDSKYLAIHIAVWLTSLLWLWGILGGKMRCRRPGLLGWLLLAYLALNLVAALASAHVVNSLNAWRIYAVYTALFFMTASAFRIPEQVLRLMGIVCGGIALSSAYALCQRAGLDPFPWAVTDVEEYRNLPSTFGNPNIATHALNLGLVLALTLAATAFGKCRSLVSSSTAPLPPTRGERDPGGSSNARFGAGIAMLAIGALIGLNIYLTEVRAARVALIAAAGIVVVAPAVARIKAGAVARTGWVVAVVFGVAMAGMGGGMALTKAKTGHWLPLDRSLLLRYNGYYGAARMIADKPLLGYGPGNYAIENPPYWTAYERARFAVKPMVNANVHNEYLEAGVEAGLLSAGLYIALVVSAVLLALREYFAARDGTRRAVMLGLAACFCAFAVDGLFGFNLRVPVSGMMLFVLAGALEGIRRYGLGGVEEEGAVHLPSPSSRGETISSSNPSGVSKIVAMAITVSALILLAWDARSFASGYYLLRAKGATIFKNVEAANEALRRGARLAPWNFQFPRELGLLAMTRERRQALEAIEHFHGALRLHPNEVRQHVMLGMAHVNCVIGAAGLEASDNTRLHLDEARECAEKARRLCPDLAQVHELLARIDLVQARGMLPGAKISEDERKRAYASAITHFRHALAHATDKVAQDNLMLTEAYAALGDIDSAEQAYARAVEADPANDELWASYSDFARKQKRWDKFVDTAEAAYASAKSRQPVDARAASMLAVFFARGCAEGMNNPERARVVLADAIALDPTRLETWGEYARATGREERPAFVALYERVKAQMPRIAQAPGFDVLDALAKGGRAAATAAAGVLRDGARTVVAEQGPDRLAPQYGWLADIVADALTAHADDVQKPDAEFGGALHSTGFVYLMMSRWAQADVLLAQALAWLPTEQQVYCALHRTEALIQQGKPAEALPLARDAHARAPSLAQAWFQYVKALAMTGRVADAKAEYAKLMQAQGLDEPTRKQIQTELEPLLNTPPRPQ